MAYERIETTPDEFLGARGVEVTIDLQSLRTVRDWIVGIATPFKGWSMVPSSEWNSAMEAMKPRLGEPPNAGIPIRFSNRLNRREFFRGRFNGSVK